MISAEDIHLFLEANLPEYKRRDMLNIVRWYAMEEQGTMNKPLRLVLIKFERFRQFIAHEWQGEEIKKPGPRRADEDGEKWPAADACKCGGVFVIRTNKARGNKFYGCSKYPACRETKPFE